MSFNSMLIHAVAVNTKTLNEIDNRVHVHEVSGDYRYSVTSAGETSYHRFIEDAEMEVNSRVLALNANNF